MSKVFSNDLHKHYVDYNQSSCQLPANARYVLYYTEDINSILPSPCFTEFLIITVDSNCCRGRCKNVIIIPLLLFLTFRNVDREIEDDVIIIEEEEELLGDTTEEEEEMEMEIKTKEE